MRSVCSFSDATVVARIGGIHFLTPEVALLRAVAGMVPPGKSDVNPAANAIQTLVAVTRRDRW